MANIRLKATLAGLLAFGASGCMSLGGYGGYGSSYGDGYYDDGYGSDYAYNDRCYDAYGGYDDYYSQYDCYDRNDYNNRFSINIGFGGGWWNNFYYPGSGYYMFDRYGARRQLFGNFARYWGGRRAGHRWQHHGGHRDDYRGGRHRDRDGDGRRDRRQDSRDRSGIGGQIIDRVDRANDRPDAGTRRPRAAAPQVIDGVDRVEPVARPSRLPSRQIIERIERANDGAARQPRNVDRPARVEAAAAAPRVERIRQAGQQRPAAPGRRDADRSIADDE